ncbi:hypothetical protein DBT53_005895, partial [Aerococcus mictus]|uniref:hypothetical protein n=1 Tax=Aerococcus mictus TaxID=2976810 RepID=UPI002696927D
MFEPFRRGADIALISLRREIEARQQNVIALNHRIAVTFRISSGTCLATIAVISTPSACPVPSRDFGEMHMPAESYLATQFGAIESCDGQMSIQFL